MFPHTFVEEFGPEGETSSGMLFRGSILLKSTVIQAKLTKIKEAVLL